MANFQFLPTELLFQIIGYLPPSAQVSLKLVNKNFFYRTPGILRTSSKDCSQCERNAIERFVYEHELLRHGQRRCVLCDGVQSADFFGGCVPICKWHDGWFFHTSIPSVLEPELRTRMLRISRTVTKPEWVALRRSYCAHDQVIIGWDVAKCSCECPSCGHFEVVCYVRVSPYYSRPLSCALGYNRLGQLCVREEHFVGVDLLRNYKDVRIVDLEDIEER